MTLNSLLFAGSFGLDPLYAHAHADALSFNLSYGGRQFLVDPGTYCYDWSEWRRYFRSTAAHNTVRIDGLDQAVQDGPMADANARTDHAWHLLVDMHDRAVLEIRLRAEFHLFKVAPGNGNRAPWPKSIPSCCREYINSARRTR